ncbi:hypothetical protein KPA96_19180 [Burkholderia cenocepacia]|uniref:hypothetical protein n=1 Tax=Burkholderia cenocepacia TaxID=95486 RepID=UPI00285F434D|nr:hypothetical protein [Burkholderia cenocepacia]MDR8077781.1 hypothetical protein [Burkholderia cenocepacia]
MSTMSKLDVAVHQLNVAIRLFLDGDYLTSLTLAGAAEEILGRLCERAGKPVAVDFIVDYHLQDTDSALSEKKRREILLNVLNKPRNAAKHANDPGEASFDVDQAWPLQMIMRALPMCASLGVKPSEEMSKMAGWVHDHPEALQ